MSVNNLTVTSVAPGITMIAGSQIHGHVASATPQTIVYSNTGYYGPDGRIVLYRNGKQVSLIEVQQNYGLLKAGHVTAKVVSGESVNFKITEGSFNDGVGGTVLIESV